METITGLADVTVTETPRSDWESRLDGERAEWLKDVEALAAAAGGTLGLYVWDGTPSGVDAEMEGVPIYFSAMHKRRWYVGVLPPRSPDGTEVNMSGDPPPSVYCSMDRDPADVVRDVRRRLLPHAVEWFRRASGRVSNEAAYEAKIAGNVEAIHTAATAAGMSCNHGNTRSAGSVGYVYVGGYRVRVGSDRFTIENAHCKIAAAAVTAIAALKAADA